MPILDLPLPIVDGLGVFTQMKSSGLNAPTTIVTAVARDELQKLDRPRTLDVSAVPEKPVAPQVLLQLVETASREIWRA